MDLLCHFSNFYRGSNISLIEMYIGRYVERVSDNLKFRNGSNLHKPIEGVRYLR